MCTYKERNKKIFELGFIIALIAVSVYMIYVAQTTGMPGQNNQLSSMAFPKGIYIGIIAMNIYLLVVNVTWLIRHPVDKNSEKVPMIPRKSVLTFLFILVYAFAWKYIGFSVSTFLFVLVESLMLQKIKSSKDGSEEKKYPLWLTIVVALAAAVVMYVVFGMFFKVNLPDPLVNMIRGI